MEKRLCTKCNEFKGKNDFYKNHKYWCKQCRRDSRKSYYNKNKKEVNKKHNEYLKKRYKNNVKHRIAANIRRSISHHLKRNFYEKQEKSIDYLGCSITFYKKYLEDKFQGNMSWDNYGQWHIDHIIPLSSAKNHDELKELFRYDNTQPLWAEDNLRKSNKIL